MCRRELALAAAPVGAALVMVCLGLWGLGRNSMYGAEADSYYASRLPLGDLFHLLQHIDAVHGLYYLILHPWSAIAPTVFGMRVLSVLAMSAAAFLVGRLAARRAGLRAGLVAGGVFAVTPFVAEFAQDGRSYALDTALVAAIAMAFESALRTGTWRAWIRYGAAVVVAGYLHEFTLLALGAFAITLACTRPALQQCARWALVSAVAVGLVSPLIVISTTQSAAIDYLPTPTSGAVWPLAQDYFGPDPALTWALIAIAALGLRDIAARGLPNLVQLGIPLIVMPPAALILASQGSHSYYDPRYVLYGTVGVAWSVAAGADRLCGWVARATATLSRTASHAATAFVASALVVATFCAGVPRQRFDRTVASRLQDFAGPSRYLRSRAQPGDALLFSHPRFRPGILAYPQDYAATADVGLATTPRHSGTLTGVAKPAQLVQAEVLSYRRVWVVGYCQDWRWGIPIGAQSPARAEFRLAERRYFTGVCVSLYVHRDW